MTSTSNIWLAAEYHMVSTYSIRIPNHSQASASALPAPGPATVRLALIRVGIELLTYDFTRDRVFPALRDAAVRIRPPTQVAFSYHVLRALKATVRGKRVHYTESAIYREFAHACDPIIIYLLIPENLEKEFIQLLRGVGYWGRTDSLAYCKEVRREEPQKGTFAVPFNAPGRVRSLRGYFSTPVTEFEGDVKWEALMPEHQGEYTNPTKVHIYVWPLIVSEQRSSGKILKWRSLDFEG
jgi:hypothetical protein